MSTFAAAVGLSLEAVGACGSLGRPSRDMNEDRRRIRSSRLESTLGRR